MLGFGGSMLFIECHSTVLNQNMPHEQQEYTYQFIY